MFSTCLPLDIVSRVWDCYLLDGLPFLFRVALGIMQCLTPALLACTDFGDALAVLMAHVLAGNAARQPWVDCVTEQTLFSAIRAVSIPDNVAEQLAQLEEESV